MILPRPLSLAWCVARRLATSGVGYIAVIARKRAQPTLMAAGKAPTDTTKKDVQTRPWRPKGVGAFILPSAPFPSPSSASHDADAKFA
jgi:hypothetical protein